MKLTITATLAVALCALLTASASAQVTTGTPPFASFGGGPDVINLGNLNVHLDVPVLQKAGRGLDFTYDLTYDNSIWLPTTSSGAAMWTPVFNWGWAAQTQITTGFVTYQQVSQNCDTPPPIHQWITYYNWTYHDPFGGIHPFGGSMIYDPTSCNNGTKGTLGAIATDGSGLVLSAALNASGSPTTHTITTRSGQVTNPPVNLTSGYSGTTATATDRNGNRISVSSTSNTATYTDTTGASVLSVSGSATSASPLVLSYTAPGGSASYTVSYKAYTVATKFGCSSSDYGPTVNNLVDSITLPDGSTYKFTYEPTPTLPSDVTGRLASVTLPIGGTITYTYSGGSSGHITCADGSNSGFTRVTPDSPTPWTYTRTAGSGAAYTTTVIDPERDSNAPNGNETIIQFQGIYETQRKSYTGLATTLLQTTNTCYNTAASPCTGTAIVLPITQRDLYVQVGGSGIAKHTTKYDSTYGRLTEQDDYDFGNSTTPMKKQLTTYASLTNGIVGAPYQVTTQDGSGNTKAQTTYTYDVGSLTTTGAPQHVGIPSGSRGNATTIAQLVQGSTTLSSTYTYDDAGNVRIATDVNGAQTTNNYVSSAATCGFAFPSSVSEPLSMSRTFTWNCTGGVQTLLTDENNQSVTTVYTDTAFWRPSEQKFPDSGTTTFVYGLSPTSVTTSQKMNGTQSKSTAKLYDGLGRLYETQLTTDPISPIYTYQTYDSLGRPFVTYNPTRNNPPTSNTLGEPTYGSTAYVYDALGRPIYVADPDGSPVNLSYTNNTVTVTDEAGKKQTLQNDSLGRLNQVTEDPGGLGFVTTYLYDPLDNIKNVTDGSNSRTYAFDGLSRLTSESNPESGTVGYTYDTSTKGDLYKRTDARNIVTTYTFDALHRLTGKSYSDSTPPVTYVYDVNNPFSLTATNTTGRLVAIWTGVSPAFAAWSAFSYDTMGRPITQWNCASFPWAATCPSIQTTSISYDLAGNPTQLVYPSGLVVQQSYDGAGRVCQVAPSTTSCTAASTYWAANLTYDPASQLAGMIYGNGVSATFGYSSRLQENSIKYTKGTSTLFSQTYTFGTSTTNNGLITAITDAVDNGRSATYGYDSLNRLRTANTSGSTNYPAWGLSWTYDQYGSRLTQTVTAGSAPSNSVSVSGSTNRITSGYGYDASGNMTSDGSNTLTYDAEGRVISASNSGNSGSYNYSGNSVRVHQVSGASAANSIYLGSNLIGQYDNESGVLGENIFLGGQRIAAVGGASVTNGGFESGSSGWTLTGSGASIVTNATNAHSGNNYLQISTSTSATAQSPTFTVHPGDQIDFGGWVNLQSGSAAAVDWVLMTLDVNHNQVAAVVPTPWSITTAGGGWVYETGSYQVASNVAYVYFYANVYQSSGTTTAWFDDGFAIFGTHYFHTDQLSTRLLTDATGASIGQQGHFPYGESWYAQNTTTSWQFTSYQRDAESGNDYAMARSYVNRLARFSSPDPLGVGAVDPSNPQSWNRYAYVMNNPLNLVDPMGLCDPGADECVTVHGCDGINDFDVLSCIYDSTQPWLTMQNFGCYASGNCKGNFVGSGGGGGGGTTSTKRSVGSTLTCAANTASRYSIAGRLQALDIGSQGGVGGFLTNTFGGNTFSGISNLISTFVSSNQTDGQVVEQMGKAYLRGPLQGIPASVVGAQGTPLRVNPIGMIRSAAAGAVFNAVTGADETLVTLSGEVSLSTVGTTAAEFASGVGEVKFALDAVTYVGSLTACGFGWAH